MITRKHFSPAKTLVVLSVTALLSACGGKDNDFSNVQVPEPTPPPTPEPAPEPIQAFDPDGTLSADIRWTTYGVPHVTADNLESMAYGVGFAFARDNLCVLADQIVKYNSERSKYFGPDQVVGSGDSAHLINDFGYLTVGIRELAEENLPRLKYLFGQRIRKQVRRVPQLQLHLDDTLDEMHRLNEIFNSITDKKEGTEGEENA